MKIIAKIFGILVLLATVTACAESFVGDAKGKQSFYTGGNNTTNETNQTKPIPPIQNITVSPNTTNSTNDTAPYNQSNVTNRT